MPAYVEAVVGREHAAVKDLERRFEQRWAGTLQDHRAFLRKGGGEWPVAWTTREAQIDRLPPGRTGCDGKAGDACLLKKPPTGQRVSEPPAALPIHASLPVIF